jgi:hypothetical protein
MDQQASHRCPEDQDLAAQQISQVFSMAPKVTDEAHLMEAGVQQGKKA